MRGVTGNSLSSIHITREHALGRAQARRLAMRWGEAAEEHLGMQIAALQQRAIVAGAVS